jgi:hypothetical protein
MTPAAGWCWSSAIVSASMMSSVRMWSAIEYPITWREEPSSTEAIDAQPSHVRIW